METEPTNQELEEALDAALAPIKMIVPDLEHINIVLNGHAEVIIEPSKEQFEIIIEKFQQIEDREIIAEILEILMYGGITIKV